MLFKVSGDFINNDGTGLYELASIANHSCSPNVSIQFIDNNK